MPITFDPIDQVESAFFDQSNFQMFCVQHGYTDVKVKGLSSEDNFKITIPARGPVSTIKFSGGAPTILSVQRRKVSVEFINIFADNSIEKSLPLKPGSADIIGFYWIFKNEYVLLITTSGVELYSCNPYRMSFKQIKNYALSVSWAIFSPEELILLVCVKGTNTLHPFMFKQGMQNAILRLPKLDVDLPVSSSSTSSLRESKAITLMERDVVIMRLYKQHYVGIMRNAAQPGQGTEVLLYQLTTEAPAKVCHILCVDIGGRFTLSMVDDLVIVHHQSWKTSMQFDISSNSETTTTSVHRHQPMLAPLTIAPTKLQVKQKGNRFLAVSPYDSAESSPGGSPSLFTKRSVSPELYSQKWVFFQPNIIIDAQFGVIWRLEVNLETISSMIPDKCQLIEFLLKREKGKSVILNVCHECLEPGRQLNLGILGGMFDRINYAYTVLNGSVAEVAEKQYKVSITQRDLYKKVFVRFTDRKEMSYKFLVAVLVEYVRSLHKLLVPVEHFLYEMIMNVLIENKCFYQLHQFLQYHVISDSKPLACLLLSRELVYPPATQLAMDMFKRLSTADSDIIDILLSRGQLLTALRYVKATHKVDTVSARQFLETAESENDKMLFYTVYNFFQSRNIRLRNTKGFPPDEQCQSFELLYRKWFTPKRE